MKVRIQFLLILLLAACTSKSGSGNSDSLEGQQWTWGRRDSNTGIGGGNSWRFLAGQRFTGTSWYSGGAYWTRNFSGSYFYDPKKQCVYLKYDKNNAPTETTRQKLQMVITETDTILMVKNGWGKSEGASRDLNLGKLPNIIEENAKFKIEYLQK